MDVKLTALNSLVAFGIPRPNKWAKDPKIQALAKSIERDGLLNPLTITPHKNKFLVIDGKKRLKALILLARTSRFHKPQQKISCIIESIETQKGEQLKRPTLMSAPELIHMILEALGRGCSPVAICQRFDCDSKIVESAPAIRNLHPKILNCFYNQVISLRQAIALSTIKNPSAQWALLQQLGPFASNDNIIQAIQSGQTVIETPDNQIIILPSRWKHPTRQKERAQNDMDISIKMAA